jgi:hypothetical protein
MQKSAAHTFHIPVMGLGFTIDTPVKVGPFGISSVVSIVDDHLVEEMREAYSKENNLNFTPIAKTEEDFRAKRISAYLNLVKTLYKIRPQAFAISLLSPSRTSRAILSYYPRTRHKK